MLHRGAQLSMGKLNRKPDGQDVFILDVKNVCDVLLSRVSNCERIVFLRTSKEVLFSREGEWATSLNTTIKNNYCFVFL